MIEFSPLFQPKFFVNPLLIIIIITIINIGFLAHIFGENGDPTSIYYQKYNRNMLS